MKKSDIIDLIYRIVGVILIGLWLVSIWTTILTLCLELKTIMLIAITVNLFCIFVIGINMQKVMKRIWHKILVFLIPIIVDIFVIGTFYAIVEIIRNLIELL